ncbi:unnamed protein product [Caenorhabditis sp. 36 PRJEB53466]|nr:unnamed protein product [Caenorhabditis sp. 36 PRJEB53466]
MSQLEKLFSENSVDSDVILEKVVQLGRDFLGGAWKSVEKERVNVLQIKGGQSNLMFHVTCSSSGANDFLVRIHRQPQSLVFVDTLVFSIFSERGVGPKLYGFFPGGRLEEFLPSRTMDADTILDAEVSRKIGAVLPRYHSIEVPVSQNRRCFQLMREWLDEYKSFGGGDYTITPTTITYSDHPKVLTIEDISREIDVCEKWAADIYEHTLVYSHNDLACGNVLELNDTKEIVLIDWEFSSYNSRGFDIAMHLSETALDFRVPFPPGIKISEELTDNPPNLELFCEAYIDADNKLKNRSPDNRQSEIRALIQEVEFFWPVTHLFWGISSMRFAIKNYDSGVDQDVQAMDRWAVYFHLKPRSQRIYEELSSKKLEKDALIIT